MDPHALANIFKLATYCKPIANNEGVIKENAIGMHLLNEKHDCNCVSINSMNINCANDHDWVIIMMLLVILKVHLSFIINLLLIMNLLL